MVYQEKETETVDFEIQSSPRYTTLINIIEMSHLIHVAMQELTPHHKWNRAYAAPSLLVQEKTKTQ